MTVAESYLALATVVGGPIAIAACINVIRNRRQHASRDARWYATNIEFWWRN